MEYTQVKISVEPELASIFKAACVKANESMANVLKKHMTTYSQAVSKAKAPTGVATRRQRRAAVKGLITQLEIIRLAEEGYRDRIPENLQGSSVYNNADEAIALMEEAAEILASVYMVP